MAEETGAEMNAAITAAAGAGQGMGEGLALALSERKQLPGGMSPSCSDPTGSAFR